MLKVIAASMVLVVVVSSGAFATTSSDIQQQVTQIGLGNTIDLLHGSQTASSLQNLVVSNSQCTTGICNTNAHESLLASIGESATACGNCALVGVEQGLSIVGQQGQEVTEGIGAKVQLQGLSLVADQTVAKADGEGTGNALHTIVASGEQQASNSAGTQQESSTILGMQTSSLSGAAGATGIVDSSMMVTTTQTQSSL
jgi:hypothetical protein